MIEDRRAPLDPQFLDTALHGSRAHTQQFCSFLAAAFRLIQDSADCFRLDLSKRLIDRALFAAATATWTLVHTYMPERIVLGGGMMQDHFELFAKAMRQSVENAVLVGKGEIEIVNATLGASAGVVGAASLVER